MKFTRLKFVILYLENVMCLVHFLTSLEIYISCAFLEPRTHEISLDQGKLHKDM